MGDEEVELGREGREVRGRGAEQAGEGAVEAAEQAVEQIIVGARPGGERGLGAAEAGEGAVPFRDRGGFFFIRTTYVTPDLIRGPAFLCVLVWAPACAGVTQKGSGARGA